MRSDTGSWIIGRGFPSGSANNLAVLDGGIDEVKILAEALPRALDKTHFLQMHLLPILLLWL